MMQVSGHGQASKAINGQLGAGGVIAGAALFEHTVSFPSTSSTTSLASIIQDMLEHGSTLFDTIGITYDIRTDPTSGNTDGPAMLVPPGWIWSSWLRLRINTVGSVAAGDTYYWAASTENGEQNIQFPDIAAAEEIGNVTNSLFGSSFNEGSLLDWGEITSLLDTQFKVIFVQAYVQGIQALAPNEGPPPPIT